jgi:ribulose kinase
VWGLYLYLAAMTRTIYEEIGKLFADPVFVAGGGASRNELLMQVTCDVVGRPITLLGQSELSALGAALTAAEGAGDEQTILAARSKLEETTVEPSGLSAERARCACEVRSRMLERWSRRRG